MQPFSHQVLQQRYLQPGEHSLADVQHRVARALAGVERTDQRADWQARFAWAMRRGFIPAGRILASAGTRSADTWVNCFVQPVGDAILLSEHSLPGAFTALAEAMHTLTLGGGVGYDFTHLSPRGTMQEGTHAVAGGPVAMLEVFDRACACVTGLGGRPGAQMGVLRCDHPDIEAFIVAKARGGLQTFNLSVGITDAFMQAVADDANWSLRHARPPDPGRGGCELQQDPDGRWIHRRLPARLLWHALVEAAASGAEPGLLFLDTLARDNNLGSQETLCAANPCGEQPLPAYGSCCLASLDLSRFVRHPFEPQAHVDVESLARVCAVGVRLLDNVLEATPWPLPAHRHEALAKRRIGLGITGLGDALVMLNRPYGSPEARQAAARCMQAVRDAAYAASVELAKERGAYPAFDPAHQAAGAHFASRLPPAMRARIAAHGLRNSHLLSIAPAGSISLACADNVSSGIEPAFGWAVARCRPHDGTPGQAVAVLEDHAWRLYHHLKGRGAPLTPAFVTARDIPPEDHLAMVEALAPLVDGGISKTIPLPPNIDRDRCSQLLFRAWRSGVKGLALWPQGATAALFDVSAGFASAPSQGLCAAAQVGPDEVRRCQ